jgi:anti-sigma-K factor RskA
VLDAIADAAHDAAAPEAPRVLRPASPPGDREQPRPATIRSWSPAWGAMAAAVLVALGGLLAWNIVLQNRDTSSVERLASRATSVATLKPAGGGAHGTVVYFGADRKALVITDGLGQLDADAQTYQMWAVHGDRMDSIGTMLPDAAGHAAIVVSFDAAGKGAIAVTVEPAGGSAQPTTAPILTATCIDPSTTCSG